VGAILAAPLRQREGAPAAQAGGTRLGPRTPAGIMVWLGGAHETRRLVNELSRKTREIEALIASSGQRMSRHTLDSLYRTSDILTRFSDRKVPRMNGSNDPHQHCPKYGRLMDSSELCTGR
jgi:hypothetical protein